MTHLVERLAELRKHLEHLNGLKNRIPDSDSLDRDLSLRNDVLFSLLMIAQLVIDVTGELLSREGERFDDYTDAIRRLTHDPRFDPDMIEVLERLPGFRNVVVHDYIGLDMERVVEALHALDPVGRFIEVVAQIEEDSDR